MVFTISTLQFVIFIYFWDIWGYIGIKRAKFTPFIITRPMTLKESSMQVIPKYLRDYVELIPTLKFPNWWRIRLSQSKVSAILGTVRNAINKYARRILKCSAEGSSQRPQLAITPFRQQFNTLSKTGAITSDSFALPLARRKSYLGIDAQSSSYGRLEWTHRKPGK
jgi:hypothetical protein